MPRQLARPEARVASARRLLGPLTAKPELAEAAFARIAVPLRSRFRRYVAWLDRQGYSFGSCEELPLRFDDRRIYLRYDVHVGDLLGAVALATLHEELQIPGSFQICWEHSRAETEASDLFLKLRAFDHRFVEFGLHCSPESSWIIAERFAGKSAGLDRFVGTGAADRMINAWLSAFEQDGDAAPVLVRARRGAKLRLAEIVASFRRHFGPVKTLSGHGTPLAAAYLEKVRDKPQLASLGAYLHPVEFLAAERIREHGFACELTRFDEDPRPGPRIIFENPIGDMISRYDQRASAGGGFVALFHPASWTGDHLSPFLDDLTTQH